MVTTCTKNTREMVSEQFTREIDKGIWDFSPRSNVLYMGGVIIRIHVAT